MGNKRPDLVVVKRKDAVVVDAQVVAAGFSLTGHTKYKTETGIDTIFSNILPEHGIKALGFVTITIS